MLHNYIALIPAYEPEAIMLDLLRQFQSAGYKIIVVNDGSSEKCKDLFKQASLYATVLHQPINQGKGSAIKMGLSYIQKNFETDNIIVTVDADGQHSLDDAIKICHMAFAHPDSLVLGSRALKENVPLRSQFGNTITRLVYRLSTGLKVHDTQTGLRAFSTKLLPELLSISGNRYEYEMNVLLEFARNHIPIKEVEIETIYIGDNSTSHFHTLRDSYRIYKEILKFSFASFAGFLVDYMMYSVLLLLTNHLVLSNIGARFISASVNYTLNRKFVFKSDSNLVKSALQYFLLAIIILCGNTLLLNILVNYFGIHQMIAKLVTELLFFIISWATQRFVIFRKRNLH